MKKIYAAAGGFGIVAAGFLALQACAQAPAPQPPAGAPAFEAADSNKDGTVSREEFQAFFARMAPGADAPPGMPPHDRHMHHMMPLDIKTLDKDGDGKISLEEFAAPMKAHFADLDANHDGYLEQTELPLPPRDGMPPAPLPGN